MQLPAVLLPGLGLSVPVRLATLAAATYLTAGATYLALTGISSPLGRVHRRDIGTGRRAAVLAAAVWIVAVLLWPVPLACRTARAITGRRPQPAAPARRDTAPAVSLAKPAVPPYWYRAEYTAVQVVLAEGRTVIARTWAGGLVDDAVIEFGPAHPWTRDAWELLAHVVRTALDQIPEQAPSSWPVPGSDPCLFPERRTVVFDADRAGVYVTRGRDLAPAVVR
ncbi:hypothetical protein [Kitasatospora sp. NPDC093679]|uniref:hypothetical protein n=1 Tax=Kitasatospora sp. NPDC093679 TaxID=3154983 RepID=UPI00343D5C05